jgi:hypothetical protein
MCVPLTVCMRVCIRVFASVFVHLRACFRVCAFVCVHACVVEHRIGKDELTVLLLDADEPHLRHCLLAQLGQVGQHATQLRLRGGGVFVCVSVCVYMCVCVRTCTCVCTGACVFVLLYMYSM